MNVCIYILYKVNNYPCLIYNNEIVVELYTHKLIYIHSIKNREYNSLVSCKVFQNYFKSFLKKNIQIRIPNTFCIFLIIKKYFFELRRN